MQAQAWIPYFLDVLLTQVRRSDPGTARPVQLLDRLCLGCMSVLQGRGPLALLWQQAEPRYGLPLQAHAAAAVLHECEPSDGCIDACKLGSTLYDLAVATLIRVQGLCANPQGLSKWALELLHDQGWRVSGLLCLACAVSPQHMRLQSLPAEQLESTSTYSVSAVAAGVR